MMGAAVLAVDNFTTLISASGTTALVLELTVDDPITGVRLTGGATSRACGQGREQRRAAARGLTGACTRFRLSVHGIR